MGVTAEDARDMVLRKLAEMEANVQAARARGDLSGDDTAPLPADDLSARRNGPRRGGTTPTPPPAEAGTEDPDE